MPRSKSEAKLESDFQNHELVPELEALFPGCIILKNDERLQQGIPDLTLLWQDRWAFLEVKASERAVHQPNQGYFIRQAGRMSYGAFIYPENKEAILRELQFAFSS